MRRRRLAIQKTEGTRPVPFEDAPNFVLQRPVGPPFLRQSNPAGCAACSCFERKSATNRSRLQRD